MVSVEQCRLTQANKESWTAMSSGFPVEMSPKGVFRLVTRTSYLKVGIMEAGSLGRVVSKKFVSNLKVWRIYEIVSQGV
jgi:hypothetical protein